MDLLERLKASGPTTVAALAADLGVSRRTLLRDLATLRGRGWPIRSDPGPGGGVFLERDRGVAAVHLSLDEAVALWLSVQVAHLASGLPFGRAARGALQKLAASLPPERARALRSLSKRVVVGQPAGPAVLATLGPPPAELLSVFEAAFTECRCLAFGYVDRHGRTSQRVVEPHGLLLEPPAWYLLTRDTEASPGEIRMFRMDRVHRPRVLRNRPFEPDFGRMTADYFARRA